MNPDDLAAGISRLRHFTRKRKKSVHVDEHTLLPAKNMKSDLSSSSSSSSVASPPASSKTLHFFVRLVSRTLVIHAKLQDTVDSVIGQINRMTGIPASEQRLIYRGRQLQLDSTLADCAVQNDASLQLTGRLRSTQHPRSWQLVNDLVRSLSSNTDSDQLADYPFVNLIEEFLSMTADIDGDSISEDIWGHLQVFMLAGVPALLINLYHSPIPVKRVLANRAIRLFLYPDHVLLPNCIHRHFDQILLEFCKLLAGTAGRDDPMYTECRNVLASLLDSQDSAYFTRCAPAEVIDELLPFVLELIRKVLASLSSHSMDVHSTVLLDFSRFLGALSRAVQNRWGGSGSIPDMCSNERSQYEDWMGALHASFTDLLKKLDHCLKKVDILLSKRATRVTDSSWVLASPIPAILAGCSAFFKIYERAEELLHSVLLRRHSALNLLLKHAGRNADLCWILRHKDLTDSDTRKNLVQMMFPENEADLFEMLINRSQLLAESFEYINAANAASLHGGILIAFKGEEATGHGVLREWFSLLSHEIFSPENVLFLSCTNDHRRFYPNPASAVDPLHLQYFRFCGRLIALALMHKVQIGIVFDRVFFLQLAGKSVGLEDIQEADPCLYMSCKKLLEMDASLLDSDALGLTFVKEVKEMGSHRTIELCPRGKDTVVTSWNREKYVDLLIQHSFSISISKQVAYFAEGFDDILGNSGKQKLFFEGLYLEDFNELLGGTDSIIDITEWMAHTEYKGYNAKDREILWFWKIVKGMSLEQQRGLLYFWTSVKYLPVNGFLGLASKLYIYRSERLHDSLPTSQTCFYRLRLPEYESECIMSARLKLITQEHFSSSFGLW